MDEVMMSIADSLSIIATGANFLTAVKWILQISIGGAIAVILLFGLLFFLPALIASMRHITARKFVCGANILSVLTLIVNWFVPIIIWLILMIVAVLGKPEHKKQDVPTIHIQMNHVSPKGKED